MSQLRTMKESVMDKGNYEFTVREIQTGSRTLKVWTPNPEQVKRDYEERQGQGDQHDFPFWTKIWPSSLALSSFIEKNYEFVQGKTVLEVGAGLGLPSMIASYYARLVVCTDYLPEAVDVISKNAELNDLPNMHGQLLDWSSGEIDFEFDVLLASDINYDTMQFDHVLFLFNQTLAKGKSILLSTPDRLQSRKFMNYLESKIVHTEQFEYRENHPAVIIGVFLLSNEK
jgi:predicted nicotinamide N-methyase